MILNSRPSFYFWVLAYSGYIMPLHRSRLRIHCTLSIENEPLCCMSPCLSGRCSVLQSWGGGLKSCYQYSSVCRLLIEVFGLGVQGRFEALSIQVEELHLYISVSKFNLLILLSQTTEVQLPGPLSCFYQSICLSLFRPVDICHTNICNEWNSIVLMNCLSIFIKSQC